jgi:hypothetical protein
MTKYVLIILSFSSIGNADCPQKLYDVIYKAMVERVLNHRLSQTNIETKNDGIEALRVMCNGQLSSYEKGEEVR